LVGRKYFVRAIRRSSNLPFFISPTILEAVEWVDGDILDPFSLDEAMEGCEAVIHAAAKVSFRSSEWRQLYKTNVEGTANVANAALEKKISRFVYVSSVAALGRSANGASVNEGNEWEEVRFNTQYARSKYQAEMEVWRAFAEGLPAVIVNPSTILGFGDWNTTSCAIFKSVYQGFPWYTMGVNGFVDVRDTADLVARLMESDIIGERFLLNSENWTFRDLFNCIADEFSKKRPSREATPLMAGLAWRLERLKSVFSSSPSVLTRESARVAQSRTYFENRKILQFLPGYSFTPLADTVRRSCQEYLRQVALSS